LVGPYLEFILESIAVQLVGNTVFKELNVLFVSRLVKLNQKSLHRDLLHAESGELGVHGNGEELVLATSASASCSDHVETRRSIKVPYISHQVNCVLHLGQEFKSEQDDTTLVVINVLRAQLVYDTKSDQEVEHGTSALTSSSSVQLFAQGQVGPVRMSEGFVKGCGGMVSRCEIVINSKLILSRLEVVRLDSVHVLGVGLMVSHIIDFNI